MGSLTGVGGPAQIIFILLFDVPNYMIKVNFCMQSIPSAAVRFFAALFNGTLKSGMIPYFINSLIAGYVGIYIGSRMGKLVGPMSYNIFVLGLLLISSLIMITNNVWLLMGSLLVTLTITIGVAYWELKKMKPAVDSQRALEKELDDIEGHPTATNTNNDNDKDTNYNKNNKVVKGGNESDEEDGTTPVSNNSMNSVRRVRRAELKRPPSLFLDDTTANNRKYVGEEKVKHRSEEDEDLPV
ncbi:hypothetical protein ADEAN_000515400 [Angomonas deanei]|uniref:Sulfite exporter TauE/SafE n=1 Tax=Angomonas deanei TaxID=59799 RepID=A0A7G2CFL8_9TRYP|nr:hypothetical protein ADEAN_000515400 [Angomonas deanei]